MMTIQSFLYKWLPIFFGCHCRSDRSLYYRGKQFPICARCTGELIGILVSFVLFWFWRPTLTSAIIMLIPLIIDGFVQRLTSYESNNFKRMITGFLFGIGFAAIISITLSYAFNLGLEYGRNIREQL